MPSQHCSGKNPRALLREAARTSSSHPAIGFAAVTDESNTDSDYSVSLLHVRKEELTMKCTGKLCMHRILSTVSNM